MVSILNIGTSGQLLLGARLFTLFTRLRRPAGGLSDFGRLVLARSKPLGGGRTLSDRARRVLYL